VYTLNVYVLETPAGLRCSARLYDTLDTGEFLEVASHGPITRSLPDGAMRGLEGLLQGLERYSALLEYGAHVDGTLAQQLFEE